MCQADGYATLCTGEGIYFGAVTCTCTSARRCTPKRLRVHVWARELQNAEIHANPQIRETQTPIDTIITPVWNKSPQRRVSGSDGGPLWCLSNNSFNTFHSQTVIKQETVDPLGYRTQCNYNHPSSSLCKTTLCDILNHNPGFAIAHILCAVSGDYLAMLFILT